MAYIALLALALGAAAMVRAPATVGARLLLVALTLGAAVVVGFAVTEVGALAAVIVIACASVWLAAAYQLRPL